MSRNAIVSAGVVGGVALVVFSVWTFHPGAAAGVLGAFVLVAAVIGGMR